jgi:hypothetical protein
VDELDSHQTSVDGHQHTWGCEPEGSGEAGLVRAKASHCIEDCECTGDGAGCGHDAEDSVVGIERDAGNDDDDDGGDREDDHEPLGQHALNSRTSWPEGVKAQHEGYRADLLFWFQRRVDVQENAGAGTRTRTRKWAKSRERERVCVRVSPACALICNDDVCERKTTVVGR